MRQIIGQPRALHVLRQATAEGRMHHAWIFHGPPGVGKCTTARALAKQLLCHQLGSDPNGHPEACGHCKSCRLFDSGGHPDLHVIQKELALYSDDAQTRSRKLRTIPVEVIREHLLGPAYRSAQLNHQKVFIVDEAELLNLQGQNAMLKTLEEPPAGTYILLMTSNETHLLPTIRSRCQRLAFERLSDDQVREWLEHRDDLAMEPDQVDWIARHAQGSLGQALLAVTYGFDRWYATLAPMVRGLATGSPDTQMGEEMARLVEDFAKQWVENHKQENASKEAANKLGLGHLLQMLGEMCRAALRACVERDANRSTEEVEAEAAPWLVGIDLLQQAERDAEANVALALLLDRLAIEWNVSCRTPGYVSGR